MSGPDWRQQEELEQEEWEALNAIDFVDGQQCAKDKKLIPITASKSFKKGYAAEKELEEINVKKC